MRKILIGAAVVTLGATTAFATGASAGGNGAAKSGLSPQAGSSTSDCVQGSGAGGNGFAILNAVGKPGATFKDVGEVSLKNAAPNTAYTVWTSMAGSDSCMMQGTIETNGQGNGNAHLASTDLGAGTFYVVIKDGTTEKFASGPLAVK